MKKLIILASILAIAVTAGAYNGWQSKVPNGSVNSCNTCHLNGDFYDDFSSAGNTWTAALAIIDSDGDGFLNGVELLDPAGTWSEGDADPGDPAYVTNPDDDTDYPTAVESSSLGEVKANFK